ncbi:hypothetical protein BLA29_013891 [Euroglyphus maynei]|uniref:Peptidase A2B Ty3 transposon peptidase domain-containing protein n=1 Tax=Euroglyphus maynei TaxID=6958 RepID=A0A1Y3BB36_EURMA|nr:hypothetical protein BLA29_013891 [Euroglyphus maynei]
MNVTDAGERVMPEQISESSSSTSVMLTMHDKSLHKTIVTTINNQKVRILFDDGAGVSFISKRLTDLWRMESFEDEPIRIDTISETEISY